MNKAKWSQTKEPFVTNETKFYAFESDVPYTAAMLIEDLIESGVEVNNVLYEASVGDDGPFSGGNLSAEGFLRRYDTIRTKGIAGTDYEISCVFDGVPFRAAISDDIKGVSYNKVAFKTAESAQFDIEALLKAMEK